MQTDRIAIPVGLFDRFRQSAKYVSVVTTRDQYRNASLGKANHNATNAQKQIRKIGPTSMGGIQERGRYSFALVLAGSPLHPCNRFLAGRVRSTMGVNFVLMAGSSLILVASEPGEG